MELFINTYHRSFDTEKHKYYQGTIMSAINFMFLVVEQPNDHEETCGFEIKVRKFGLNITEIMNYKYKTPSGPHDEGNVLFCIKRV